MQYGFFFSFFSLGFHLKPLDKHITTIQTGFQKTISDFLRLKIGYYASGIYTEHMQTSEITDTTA